MYLRLPVPLLPRVNFLDYTCKSLDVERFFFSFMNDSRVLPCFRFDILVVWSVFEFKWYSLCSLCCGKVNMVIVLWAVHSLFSVERCLSTTIVASFECARALGAKRFAALMVYSSSGIVVPVFHVCEQLFRVFLSYVCGLDVVHLVQCSHLDSLRGSSALFSMWSFIGARLHGKGLESDSFEWWCVDCDCSCCPVFGV